MEERITPENESLLRLAYVNSTYYNNDNNKKLRNSPLGLDALFCGYEQFNLIYTLIERMSFVDPQTHWKVRLLHADGGVRSFQVHYRIGGYTFLMADVNQNDGFRFESLQDFAKWMDEREARMPSLKITETLNFDVP